VIHPRRIRRGPDQTDFVVPSPTADFGPFVGREVIKDQVNSFFDRIARAHPFESSQDIVPAFAPTGVSPELVLLGIEKGKPLASSVWPGIGCGQTVWVCGACPRSASDGSEFNGSHFIIAQNVRATWDGLVESIYAFF